MNMNKILWSSSVPSFCYSSNFSSKKTDFENQKEFVRNQLTKKPIRKKKPRNLKLYHLLIYPRSPSLRDHSTPCSSQRVSRPTKRKSWTKKQDHTESRLRLRIRFTRSTKPTHHLNSNNKRQGNFRKYRSEIQSAHIRLESDQCRRTQCSRNRVKTLSRTTRSSRIWHRNRHGGGFLQQRATDVTVLRSYDEMATTKRDTENESEMSKALTETILPLHVHTNLRIPNASQVHTSTTKFSNSVIVFSSYAGKLSYITRFRKEIHTYKIRKMAGLESRTTSRGANI